MATWMFWKSYVTHGSAKAEVLLHLEFDDGLVLDVFFYISLNPHLTETGSQAGACGSP